MSENQKLVKKVSINGIDKQFAEQAELYVHGDIRPNSRLNLALYNFLNTKNGKYRTDRIRNIGEPPNLLDSSLVEISRREIEKYLYDKSFFNAKVKSEITAKDKKAYIVFTAEPGPSFHINKFSYDIPDTAVRKLYDLNHSQFSTISEGSRYDGDSLRNESKEINDLLKSKGYYDYVQQYVRFELDSTLYSSKVNVKLILENPADLQAHKVYYFNDTKFVIKSSNGETKNLTADSVVVDSQYTFIDFSEKFKPKPIVRYVFLKKGDKYDLEKKNLTYDRLYNLNVFRSVNIDFVKTSDSTGLDAVIEAIPLKRLSNRIEGEFTFNSGRSGFNIGNTYTNRNVFGGGEQFDLRIRYGLLFNSNKALGKIFNRDVQVGANLIFPRLLVPFNTDRIGKNGIPHTTISSSLQIFDQIDAFRSRLFINSITYDWVETPSRIHSFTPVNVEYRNGKLDDAFKEDLRSKGYELYIRTNDRQYFNLGSLYTFTLNNNKLLSYDNFLYFRSSNDFGGNSLNLVAKALNLPRNSENVRTFMGLPYLRYAKTEADLRWYKSLGAERQFIARINPGFAVPFGQDEELPFEKNFYAGGSSGIRAWQARTLGPGNYNRGEALPDATTRRNFTNLDQLGEIKVEGNLEYRFKIVNNFFGSKLKGATFADFGNVWRIEETASNPEGEFKLNRFMKQFAIGAGAGLRFDVDYFIFRFDVGVKIKDPQFDGQDQWVIKEIFNKSFKDEYFETHNPESYRFLQYNFGIGLPF